jgi:hypothetical protein
MSLVDLQIGGEQSIKALIDVSKESGSDPLRALRKNTLRKKKEKKKRSGIQRKGRSDQTS